MGFEWCNHYNCFCKDVEEIVEDKLYCEFNCNRCDESRDIETKECEKASVLVFQMPVQVRITCPHCGYDIEMSYEDFTNLMGSDYPWDWDGQKIKCDGCKKEIEIDDNEWD